VAEPDLSPERGVSWRNWHVTQGIGGRVDTLFTPRNHWLDGSAPPPDRPFDAGIAALRAIVRQAERDGRRVRAVGSGWSLSPVAFTEDYLVNTTRLAESLLGFESPGMLAPEFQARRDRMVFAQCGMQVKTLNGYLERRRLCLPTSGASNGQTIAGAVSTGTHGSANRVGAMQDFILGIHLVAEGGEHYFIQRASRPAASRRFSDWLGAIPRLDDKLFDAAVVGFGSFGLVHGLLFEAEPLYVLEKHVWQRDYAAVVPSMTTLDVASLGLPRGAERPFHFEVVINPYRVGPGEGGAFVRFMYRRPLGPGEPLPPAPAPPGGLERTEDLVTIVSWLSDTVPAAIPPLLQSQLVDALAPTEGRGPMIGTPGQIFSDSVRTNGGNSMEIGVPLASAGRAVDLILGVYREHTFGAPVALRFVKQSTATLALTSLDEITCTIELPGIDSDRTRTGYGLIQHALAKSPIRHSYHWGQALPLDDQWVREAYGPRRDAWLAARQAFLSPRGRAMFANALVARCGLVE
jgi:hypothetical protein